MQVDIGFGSDVDLSRRPADQAIHPRAELGVYSHLELAQLVPRDPERGGRPGVVPRQVVVKQRDGRGEQMCRIVIANGGLRRDHGRRLGREARDSHRRHERLELA